MEQVLILELLPPACPELSRLSWRQERAKMVPCEEVRTKTVQSVVCISLWLIIRRRKEVNQLQMMSERGGGKIQLPNHRLLPGTLCIHILTHGHLQIVNLLGEVLSFCSFISFSLYPIQDTMVAFFHWLETCNDTMDNEVWWTLIAKAESVVNSKKGVLFSITWSVDKPDHKELLRCY